MGNCEKCWDTGKLKMSKSRVSINGKREVGFENEVEEVFCSCSEGQKLKEESEGGESDAGD